MADPDGADGRPGLFGRVRAMLRGRREILTLEDPMTLTTFNVIREGPGAALAAAAAFVWSIGVVGALLWELVDVWSGRMRLLGWLGLDPAACAASPTFRRMAFVVIGGGLGSALSSLRSLIFWHCTHRAFEPRFLWRYVTGPLSGGALAMLVQILVQAGTAVLGSDGPGSGSRQSMTLFAIGMLSGYGAEQVTRWLDDHVRRLFRPTGEPTARPGAPPSPAPTAPPEARRPDRRLAQPASADGV